ncbi:MAG: kelch repeat-containing protein [Pseudomonadota bacterium]
MTQVSLTRRAAIGLGSAALVLGPNACAQSLSDPREPSGVWRLGTALPYAVQEIYPTRHNGRIHLAGGFIAKDQTISGATDQHIAYDLQSGVWETLAPLPRARHHPNLISFNGTLLAIGGFEVGGADAVWQMQAGIWIFDGETWRDGPSLPQPNGESVLAVIADRLHVCGGRTPVGASNASWNDHNDVADHYVLDRGDGEWAKAAPLPTARNSAAAAVIGADWHVVGGRTVAEGNSAAHEVYDAYEDRWRQAAPLPQAQGGLAAGAVGDKLYAFGGEYFDNGGGVYAECWAYSADTDAWSRLPDMPKPRHGLGAVVVDKEIYLIGGALKVGGRQTSNLVEIFAP